jgi:hypothetical protein
MDVAVMRLVVRLRRADVPWWQIKGLLAFKGDDLRAAFERASRHVLVVQGARAALVTPRKAEGMDVDVQILLAEVLEDCSNAASSVRQERPADWAVPVQG